MKKSHIIIECSYCKAKVAGKILGRHESTGSPDDEPFRVLLLECPVCENALVSGQSLYPDCEWDNPTRLWPAPEKHISWNIPILVRDALKEARKCYGCGAYNACAVMCGKALEGICSKYDAKAKTLVDRLKILLDRQIIDAKLYEWSKILIEHRNLGAHIRKEEKILEKDARDLLDFLNAICDYIFVLTDKFTKFMERKKEKTKK